MEMRQLQYLVALADTLHFGKAAQRMHIAQSAFSGQIARLEREIGAQLFLRANNRVNLTPAGEAFLPRAIEILAQVDRAGAEARTTQAAVQEHLTIGLFADAAGELTPLIIAAFRGALPDVDVRFQELSMVDQIDALANEKVDVAFVRTPVVDSRVEVHELFAEPRFAALGAQHELADFDAVTVEQLADEPFAVASPDAPSAWSGFWSMDDVRGEPGRVGAYVTNVSESLSAVAYQGAVDTFPGAAARMLRYPGVVYRPLIDGSYAPVAVANRRNDQRHHVATFTRIALRLAQSSLGVVPGAVPACRE